MPRNIYMYMTSNSVSHTQKYVRNINSWRVIRERNWSFPNLMNRAIRTRQILTSVFKYNWTHYTFKKHCNISYQDTLTHILYQLCIYCVSSRPAIYRSVRKRILYLQKLKLIKEISHRDLPGLRHRDVVGYQHNISGDLAATIFSVQKISTCNTVLLNVGILPHHYTASETRRPRRESWRPWKSEVSQLPQREITVMWVRYVLFRENLISSYSLVTKWFPHTRWVRQPIRELLSLRARKWEGQERTTIVVPWEPDQISPVPVFSFLHSNNRILLHINYDYIQTHTLTNVQYNWTYVTHSS